MLRSGLIPFRLGDLGQGTPGLPTQVHTAAGQTRGTFEQAARAPPELALSHGPPTPTSDTLWTAETGNADTAEVPPSDWSSDQQPSDGWWP